VQIIAILTEENSCINNIASIRIAGINIIIQLKLHVRPGHAGAKNQNLFKYIARCWIEEPGWLSPWKKVIVMFPWLYE